MSDSDERRADPWWQRALDLLFPPRCVHCGRRGADLCPACRRQLQPVGPAVCPRCSAPSTEGRICRRCVDRLQAIRALIAAYPFEGPARSAVLGLKYRGRTRLARYLTAGLEQALERRPLTIDVVVPVPLSPARLRARGFNQSELLARPVAARHGWSLRTDLLQRMRDTPQQTRLPARERRRNLVGAFAVAQPTLVDGQRVLLVDDVATTGATLEACAGPLLAAGAAGVWGLVVARDV